MARQPFRLTRFPRRFRHSICTGPAFQHAAFLKPLLVQLDHQDRKPTARASYRRSRRYSCMPRSLSQLLHWGGLQPRASYRRARERHNSRKQCQRSFSPLT